MREQAAHVPHILRVVRIRPGGAAGDLVRTVAMLGVGGVRVAVFLMLGMHRVFNRVNDRAGA